MSHFNCRVRGENALESKAQSLQYHWADRNGRMYLCGCLKAFRTGARVKQVLGGRYKQSKMAGARRLALMK